MANVVFQFENGEKVTVSTMTGENLLETARKSNVVIDAPCSGNGSCGKCRVKLLGGDVYKRQMYTGQSIPFLQSGSKRQ